jgi:hypothetical protein
VDDELGQLVDAANACMGVDIEVESASSDRVVLVTFVDDPPPHGRPWSRLIFIDPTYMQLATRMSLMRLRATRWRDWPNDASRRPPRWELKSRPNDPRMPSLDVDALSDDSIVFEFESVDRSIPGEFNTRGYVVADSAVVEDLRRP